MGFELRTIAERLGLAKDPTEVDGVEADVASALPEQRSHRLLFLLATERAVIAESDTTLRIRFGRADPHTLPVPKCLACGIPVTTDMQGSVVRIVSDLELSVCDAAFHDDCLAMELEFGYNHITSKITTKIGLS